MLVVGLLATTTPSRADTTATITAFTATATLGAGLDYVCNPFVPGLPCPPPLGTRVCDLPLNPADPVDINCHQDYGHNRTSVNIATTTCVGTFTTVNKPGKEPEHAGNCTASTTADPKPNAKTVTGWCGLAGGQVALKVTDPLGQVYFLDLHFTVTKDNIVLNGHYWKFARGTTTNHGKVIIEGEVLPITGSCTDKTARGFLITGRGDFIPSPTL